MTETIINFILAFCFAFPFALFATPIFIYLKKVMYHPTQQKKIFNKAIKDGHVLQAKLIKEHDVTSYHPDITIPVKSWPPMNIIITAKRIEESF